MLCSSGLARLSKEIIQIAVLFSTRIILVMECLFVCESL